MHRFLKVQLRISLQSLLGERYGHRPIPNSILETEFETILSKAKVFDSDKVELLKSWYRKDTNSQPPAYILQVSLSKCSIPLKQMSSM